MLFVHVRSRSLCDPVAVSKINEEKKKKKLNVCAVQRGQKPTEGRRVSLFLCDKNHHSSQSTTAGL